MPGAARALFHVEPLVHNFRAVAESGNAREEPVRSAALETTAPLQPQIKAAMALRSASNASPRTARR